MQPLQIFAGEKALQKIKQEGFNASLFSAFLGASGGPKWFVLAGLDKVLFNDFLDHADQHIDLIGTSVGAFRCACFAQRDPASAILRLQDRYCNATYSVSPTPKEITQKSQALLNHMLGTQAIVNVLNNRKRSLHVISVRCHGLVASENKVLQSIGLSSAAMRNVISRRALSYSFTRAVVHTGKCLRFTEKERIFTEYAALSSDNIYQALLASGSIPLIIEGVDNIPGLGPGMFRDGGIVDYHFDLKLQTPGLVLYPHFSATPIPGWFDKKLNRQCHPESYENIVLLAPSPEFVETLPYKRISDRSDFQSMPTDERIRYWNTVISESDRLAESFFEQINSSEQARYIRPIKLRR